jgi:hypothetical protein
MKPSLLETGLKITGTFPVGSAALTAGFVQSFCLENPSILALSVPAAVIAEAVYQIGEDIFIRKPPKTK